MMVTKSQELTLATRRESKKLMLGGATHAEVFFLGSTGYMSVYGSKLNHQGTAPDWVPIFDPQPCSQYLGGVCSQLFCLGSGSQHVSPYPGVSKPKQISICVGQ